MTARMHKGCVTHGPEQKQRALFATVVCVETGCDAKPNEVRVISEQGHGLCAVHEGELVRRGYIDLGRGVQLVAKGCA